MTREEFYKLTDILNSEVLGNFMHGGEADELIAMFEEAVEHSNILEQEEPVSDIDAYQNRWGKSNGYLAEPVSEELESWDKFSHIDDAIEDYCRYDSHIVFFTESLNGEPLEEADDREQVESAFKAGAHWQKRKDNQNFKELAVLASHQDGCFALENIQMRLKELIKED